MKHRSIVFGAVLLLLFAVAVVRTTNSQDSIQKPKKQVVYKTDNLEINNPNKIPTVATRDRIVQDKLDTEGAVSRVRRTPAPCVQEDPLTGFRTTAGIMPGKDIFAGDTVLGVDHDYDLHNSAIAIHSNGIIYHAFEDIAGGGDKYIRVTKSSDGGKTWQRSGWSYQPGNQLTDPSIAVTDDTVVIAYVVDNGSDDPYVEVATASLTATAAAYAPHSTLEWTSALKSEGYRNPYVWTDYHSYPSSSSVYLICEWVVEGAVNNVNIDFQRSADDGANWKDHNCLHGVSDSDHWLYPHGSWGEGTYHYLHTICFNNTDKGLYYRNSSDWGVTFSAEQNIVTVTYLPDALGQNVTPQIAARSLAGNDDVMVVYNSGSSGGIDDDVKYIYTLNHGSTWTGPYDFPGLTTEHEFGITLHCNPRGGGWYCAFTRDPWADRKVFLTVRRSSAVLYSSPMQINSGGKPSMDYSQKGLGSFWDSNYPCVVWEDFDYHVTNNYSPYFNRLYPDDLVGTWATQGVYYRDDQNNWVKMSTNPANIIAVGDLDGDDTADIVGDFPADGGAWVKRSSTGGWTFLGSSPDDMCAGDMDGDGTEELMGTWAGQGCYYLNAIGGIWYKIGSAATMVAAGDLDYDNTDDLIGVWPGQGGVWYKASGAGTWHMLGSTPRHIAAGDMDGDGHDELLGTWDGQGVYYLTHVGGSWVKMASPATLIATGDFDGDGISDLAGIWPSQGGIWAKFSSTGSWVKLSSSADDLAAGMMRGGTNTWGVTGLSSLVEAMMQPVKEPGVPPYTDFSLSGPGGPNFSPVTLYENLVPEASAEAQAKRVPGPGEAGFTFTEQENLDPPMDQDRERKNKKVLRH